MKTAKQLQDAKVLAWSPLRCPHCQGAELVKTGATHADTDGKTVVAYQCPACEYTEGRTE